MDAVRAPDGATELDLVGDIHSENYGTYKAADGVVHYDLNDFDETTRGSCDFDLCRLTTSWTLASRAADPLADYVNIALSGVTAYLASLKRLLKKGDGFDVTEAAPCASNDINELIAASTAAKRTDFINKLSHFKDGKRTLIRNAHYFNLPEDEKCRHCGCWPIM